MHRARILFVHNYPMRFVEVDLSILRENYEVTELYLKSKFLNPFKIAIQVRSHDLTFAWFASWHSLLPLMFSSLAARPSILIIGGYDTANLPDIGYGHQRGGIRRWVSRLCARFAEQLVTGSNYAKLEAVRNMGLRPERISVVHHGVDPKEYAAPARKEAIAVTVGNVNKSNLTRKGLERFVQAARYLPDVPFILIGPWFDESAEYLRGIASPNVKITGKLTDQELREYLRRAKVYVQASAHEGFGMALAEAMLCGCVPVVSDNTALPEVVGDTGVYLRADTPSEVARCIQEALSKEDAEGDRARRRIIDEFPLEKRRKGLGEIIEGLLRR